MMDASRCNVISREISCQVILAYVMPTPRGKAVAAWKTARIGQQVLPAAPDQACFKKSATGRPLAEQYLSVSGHGDKVSCR